MSLYVNPSLGLTLSYPLGFVPRPPEALAEVLREAHLGSLGSAPALHGQLALDCLHTLFLARRGTGSLRARSGSSVGTSIEASAAQAGVAAETILLVDADRVCLTGKAHGDRSLQALADTVLRLPQVSPLVAAGAQGSGEHRLHAGMSSGVIVADEAVPGSESAAFGRQVPVYVVAASLEQQRHQLLVVYVTGLRGEGAREVAKMQVCFRDGESLRLFPFLGPAAGSK